MNMKISGRKTLTALLVLCAILFTACGRRQEKSDHYEIVDGKIVLVTGEDDDVIHTGYENGPAPGEAAADPGVEITDGTAFFPDEDYNSLQEGDDFKTVQSNLGHATASFTLDVYGHVSDKMKEDSARRQQEFIQRMGFGI